MNYLKRKLSVIAGLLCIWAVLALIVNSIMGYPFWRTFLFAAPYGWVIAGARGDIIPTAVADFGMPQYLFLEWVKLLFQLVFSLVFGEVIRMMLSGANDPNKKGRAGIVLSTAFASIYAAYGATLLLYYMLREAADAMSMQAVNIILIVFMLLLVALIVAMLVIPEARKLILYTSGGLKFGIILKIATVATCNIIIVAAFYTW